MNYLPSSHVSSSRAALLLQRGAVGILPTDTVYGLAARAQDQQAVQRLYALKSRVRKPGTIVAANIEQLYDLGVDKTYLDAASQWWPGPVSVIVPLNDKLAYLHQNVDSGAVRVVADEALRKILLQTGPLLTSSANHPGKTEAATTADAWNYFKNDVDFYVDGGDFSDRAPSTIIQITDTGNITVIRQGAFASKLSKRWISPSTN
jgi:L-threonylcarbamoyladenylate synthase